MDRKGIMLEFLVTVILALLIFTPTCIFTSKFFRISQQAGENFHAFVDELEAFAQDEQRLSKTAVLIMDEETVIIGFNKPQPVVTCVEGLYLHMCKEWEVPNVQECSGPCICLIRKMKLPEGEVPLIGKTTYESVTCKAWEQGPFATQDSYEMPKMYDFSYSVKSWTEVNSGPLSLSKDQVTLHQTVKNGFFLARAEPALVEVDTPDFYARTAYDINIAGSLQFSARRNPVYLQKREGKLLLCGEEACHDTIIS